MIDVLLQLNWLSVALAFVVYFILGALWFTLFFSTPYKISLGRKNETLENKPIFIVGPALCTLLITITTALLFQLLNLSSYSDALAFALLIGVGYLVANTVNIAINPNIPRPILYGIISGSYHLVGIVMVCIILTMMKS